MDKGCRAYYGPLSEFVPYLQQEAQCQIPAHYSPYDLVLDILNPVIGVEDTFPGMDQDFSEKFPERYEQSDLRKRMDDRKPTARDALSVKDLAVRRFNISR